MRNGNKKQGAIMTAVKYREVLRLWLEGYNDSEVARACGCSRPSVQDYRQRATAAQISMSQLQEATDSELLGLLGKKKSRQNSNKGPPIDWAWVASELKRAGVTLALLWEEKVNGQAIEYSYSTFCRRFYRWAGSEPTVSLRQTHIPGEKSFVDYSGSKLSYCDRTTGEILEAEIFVGSLGASNLTFVEASRSQALECWVGSHVRMFSYMGGVTAAVVPDNLKSGVTKANKYEPEINRAYQEFAEHYGTAIIPARANKPKDKAKVEKAVQDIQHWILAPLRDRLFTSIWEINEAIKPLLEEFNTRVQKTYGKSRRELFEQVERQSLKALPALPYEFANWKLARVNIDYHIEFERHYYSVPYYLVRKDVELRITERLVEILFDHKRIAFHARSRIAHQHTTLFEHMPKEHQAVCSWSKDKFCAWSKSIGIATTSFVDTLFSKKAHSEQAFRAIMGLQRLAQKYGSCRLESACKRANHFKLFTMHSVRSILETGKDKEELQQGNAEEKDSSLWHQNLRGNQSFH
mgnify:CR=1 FL=1